LNARIAAGIVRDGGSATARRGPLVRVRIGPPSSRISTVPSVSVRSTRAPAASSRSRVSGFGWPYRFFAPADTIASAGSSATMNGAVDAVPLP
jgi:hypothetical protein